MNLTLLLKTIEICTIVVIFLACSRSQENEYIGYWIEDNKKITEPLEITMEGDKLFLKAENIDVPADYNKEDKSLTAPISFGIAKVEMIMNLVDSDHLKMTLNNKSHKMSRITKDMAERRRKEFYAYKSPEFFIGEWKRDSDQKTLKIIKEGKDIFYISESQGKIPLHYSKESNELFFNTDPLFRYSFKHSGESDIFAFGKIYKKIK